MFRAGAWIKLALMGVPPYLFECSVARQRTIFFCVTLYNKLYKCNFYSKISTPQTRGRKRTNNEPMNLNRVLLIGNLTGDPELFETGKTKIVNASLATHQFYENAQEEKQQVTTFVDLKIWGITAENFAKLVRRGKEILVEGTLRQDRWEDEKGNKRSKLYVNVLTWQFAQRKNEDSTAKAPANGLAKKR
jgi:single-strand DNA-binding protein